MKRKTELTGDAAQLQAEERLEERQAALVSDEVSSGRKAQAKTGKLPDATLNRQGAGKPPAPQTPSLAAANSSRDSLGTARYRAKPCEGICEIHADKCYHAEDVERERAEHEKEKEHIHQQFMEMTREYAQMKQRAEAAEEMRK